MINAYNLCYIQEVMGISIHCGPEIVGELGYNLIYQFDRHWRCY